MGSPLANDIRLTSIGNSVESTAGNLVKLLIENYNDQNLSLGACYNGRDAESCFSITDSDLENIFLNLIYNGSYRVELKSDNADSPYSISISLDEVLSARLPDNMKEKLQAKYDKLTFSNI